MPCFEVKTWIVGLDNDREIRLETALAQVFSDFLAYLRSRIFFRCGSTRNSWSVLLRISVRTGAMKRFTGIA